MGNKDRKIILNNGINVLSLFDGISCGLIALKRAGIPVNRYVAYEINNAAIKVSKYNHPEIEQCGDVVTADFKQYKGFDLLIGGSPCQGFSNAGKGLNFDDPRSRLFWEYVRILHEVKPKYFLLENVAMKAEWEQIITDALGVEPILINSKLTSAAIRKRLYWTNIPDVEQPEDMGITFGDIREHNVAESSGMYYTDKGLQWIANHTARTGKKLRIVADDDKMQMLEATMYKKYSSQRFFAIEDTYGKRYITPLECERCMNLPDNYTSVCSNTQRYKQLGNGWEINTLTHIFKHIV